MKHLETLRAWLLVLAIIAVIISGARIVLLHPDALGFIR